jgi:hypothetical protein
VRAQIPYIAAINCLFAEFDAVQFHNDKDRVLSHIGGLAQRPSVVIDSGGGYHAYWFLRETFYLDSPDARERAMRVQQAWVEHATASGRQDLARCCGCRDPGPSTSHEAGSGCPQPLRPLYDLGELARACHAGRPRSKPLSRPDWRVEPAHGCGTSAPPGSQMPSEQAVAEAKALLDRLAKWRCDDYDAWVQAGMALSGLGAAGLRLWDAWSRGSTKYRERDCKEKWLTFRPGEGLTLASLAFWVNRDSPPPASPSPVFVEVQGRLRWDRRRGERAFLQGRRCDAVAWKARWRVRPEARRRDLSMCSFPRRRHVTSRRRR